MNNEEIRRKLIGGKQIMLLTERSVVKVLGKTASAAGQEGDKIMYIEAFSYLPAFPGR